MRGLGFNGSGFNGLGWPRFEGWGLEAEFERPFSKFWRPQAWKSSIIFGNVEWSSETFAQRGRCALATTTGRPKLRPPQNSEPNRTVQSSCLLLQQTRNGQSHMAQALHRQPRLALNLIAATIVILRGVTSMMTHVMLLSPVNPNSKATHIYKPEP